jgi:hypothetical protein
MGLVRRELDSSIIDGDPMMKRNLITSFVALSLVAGPAIAATTTTAPAAKVMKQNKKAQLTAAKVSKKTAASTAKLIK